ncbi:hypothetical protein B484DRAFT_327904, partial [Ochromonadaceae sp. CCMP2298]
MRLLLALALALTAIPTVLTEQISALPPRAIFLGTRASDYAGGSVAMSGDGLRVAVGASGSDDSGATAGQVRVFGLSHTSHAWLQVGADIDGERPGDEAGAAVALSYDGSRVALGSPGNSGAAGGGAGAVRVFEFRGDSWLQLGADVDGGQAGEATGSSVALSADGSVLAVGA